VDRVLFGRWLLAAWNLFKYNALGVGGGGEGSNLYGIEPASFFAVNLLLNFNVLAVLAALSPFALAALWRGRSALEAKLKADDDARDALASAAGGGGGEREAEQLQELARADNDDLLHAGTPALAKLLACLAQLWFWFAVMSARPHKEERFMFVVFPLVPLAAAVSLVAFENFAVAPLARRVSAWLTGGAAAAQAPAAQLRRLERVSLARALVAGAAFACAGALSLSRVAALVYGFRAPVHVWEVLGHAIQAHKLGVENRDNLDAPQAPLLATPRPWLGLDVRVSENGTHLSGGTDYTPSVPPGNEPLVRFSNPGVVVCVGKEWYRFPSHFFLPESTRANAAKFPHPDRRHRAGGPAQLAFLRSGFGGQLPQAYRMKAGGSAEQPESVREGFNDANRAWAKYPYKSPDVCDFIVDLQLPAGRTSQPELERHMAGLPPIPAGSNFSAVEELCKQPEEREPPANCCGVDAKTSNRFESVFCEPFLDRETSPLLARAFWVPGHSAGVASFGAYHIMQRIDCCADGGGSATAGP
jgi:alpha-1,2-mannosyltransferase